MMQRRDIIKAAFVERLRYLDLELRQTYVMINIGQSPFYDAPYRWIYPCRKVFGIVSKYYLNRYRTPTSHC